MSPKEEAAITRIHIQHGVKSNQEPAYKTYKSVDLLSQQVSDSLGLEFLRRMNKSLSLSHTCILDAFMYSYNSAQLCQTCLDS